MTEKLKYKVGDKVLVEAGVTERYKGIGDLRDQIEGFDIKMSSKIIMPKPKVTQAVMEYYTQNISAGYDYDVWFERSGIPDEVASWLYYDGDDDILMQRQHALATLIAYGPEAVEVEKEKRYKVTLKATGQYLIHLPTGSYRFTEVLTEPARPTKQELIDAGFEGVFDNPMFEVEEVE